MVTLCPDVATVPQAAWNLLLRDRVVEKAVFLGSVANVMLNVAYAGNTSFPKLTGGLNRLSIKLVWGCGYVGVLFWLCWCSQLQREA